MLFSDTMVSQINCIFRTNPITAKLLHTNSKVDHSKATSAILYAPHHQGDSGGPLIMINEDGRDSLVGVVSHRHGKCNKVGKYVWLLCSVISAVILFWCDCVRTVTPDNRHLLYTICNIHEHYAGRQARSLLRGVRIPRLDQQDNKWLRRSRVCS